MGNSTEGYNPWKRSTGVGQEPQNYIPQQSGVSEPERKKDPPRVIFSSSRTYDEQRASPSKKKKKKTVIKHTGTSESDTPMVG